MQVVNLDTLGAIAGKHAVSGYCMTCRRHAWLDLAAIAAGAGWSLSIERLKHRLCCGGCGRRDIEIRLVYRPENAPGGYPTPL
jgi:hypothetical protein